MALRGIGKVVKGFKPQGGAGYAAVGVGAALGLGKAFDSEELVDYAEDIAFGTTTADEAIMGSPMGVGDLMAAPFRPSFGIPSPRFMNKQISSYADEGYSQFRKSFYHSEDLMPSPTQANRRSSGSMTNVDGSIVFGMNNLKHG